MNNKPTARMSIKDSYDIDTLRDIVSHGCESGVAHDHIYYADTIKFFDNNEEEVIDYVENTLGQEYLVEVFNNQGACLDMYKNAICWTYVELIAHELIDEFESTTQEELSELDDNVYSNLTELSDTQWGKDHLELVTL